MWQYCLSLWAPACTHCLFPAHFSPLDGQILGRKLHILSRNSPVSAFYAQIRLVPSSVPLVCSALLFLGLIVAGREDNVPVSCVGLVKLCSVPWAEPL